MSHASGVHTKSSPAHDERNISRNKRQVFSKESQNKKSAVMKDNFKDLTQKDEDINGGDTDMHEML